jgi:hypothetical protein
MHTKTDVLFVIILTIIHKNYTSIMIQWNYVSSDSNDIKSVTKQWI